MNEERHRKPDCPCTEECIHHGYCKDCRAYHNNAHDLPYCKRSGPANSEMAGAGTHQHEHGHHHGKHH